MLNLTTNGKILARMPYVEQYRKYFESRGAVLWNALPRETPEAQNIDEFKYRYRNNYLIKWDISATCILNSTKRYAHIYRVSWTLR